MSDLTNKFDLLRGGAINSIAETIEAIREIKGEGDGSIVDLLNAINLNTSTLVDIRDKLGELATTVELLNNNAASNAQKTIQAISLNACGCDVTTSEPPFDSNPGGFDCDAQLIPSLGPGQTSQEYEVTLPEGVYTFGPPRTIGEEDVIFLARYPANEENNIALTLDQSPNNGAVPAGTWYVSIINNGNDNVGSQPVGWCWSTAVNPPSAACARAQAVVAGLEAVMAAFSSMSDGTLLTKTSISLAYAAASPYIESRPPDTLTVTNLLNIYNNAEGGFNYGLIPSGFTNQLRQDLVAAIFAAQDATLAGQNVLSILEDNSGISNPYLDFVKSIPQQFWFNGVFDPASEVLNEDAFPNSGCTE